MLFGEVDRGFGWMWMCPCNGESAAGSRKQTANEAKRTHHGRRISARFVVSICHETQFHAGSHWVHPVTSHAVRQTALSPERQAKSLLQIDVTFVEEPPVGKPTPFGFHVHLEGSKSSLV